MVTESSSLGQLLKTLYDGFPKGKVFPPGLLRGLQHHAPLVSPARLPAWEAIWLTCIGVSSHRPWVSRASDSQNNFLLFLLISLTVWQSLDDVPVKDAFFCAFPDYLFSKSLIEHLLFARQFPGTGITQHRKNTKSLPSWSLF